jgi:hypothetical protein
VGFVALGVVALLGPVSALKLGRAPAAPRVAAQR